MEEAKAATAEQLAAKDSELAALLGSTEEVNSHRIKMMFHRLDVDGNGTISKEVHMIGCMMGWHVVWCVLWCGACEMRWVVCGAGVAWCLHWRCS